MRGKFALITLMFVALPLIAAAGDCCDDCCCEDTAPALSTMVFHLPLAFNDGTDVPEALVEALLADVVELAGGFTYYEATGGWMFEGRLYREPVWVVKVGIAEDQEDELAALIEARLKSEFKQEAVWLEESGAAEIR